MLTEELGMDPVPSTADDTTATNTTPTTRALHPVPEEDHEDATHDNDLQQPLFESIEDDVDAVTAEDEIESAQKAARRNQDDSAVANPASPLEDDELDLTMMEREERSIVLARVEIEKKNLFKEIHAAIDARMEVVKIEFEVEPGDFSKLANNNHLFLAQRIRGSEVRYEKLTSADKLLFDEAMAREIHEFAAREVVKRVLSRRRHSGCKRWTSYPCEVGVAVEDIRKGSSRK